MGWAEQTIWWHVYPLGFCDAPIREPDPAPAPRLRRLTAWLDHAVELGLSGLLLGPVFASESHGYDSTDQFRIDPRLGTEADLDDLVAGCRARGLRLVFDGAFSHVGSGHPWFVEALREGPGSEHAALFDIDWDAPDGPRAAVFEGHGSLVRLAHGNPQTVDYAVDVLTHWLDRGIDGWRLDAAYSVEPGFWAAVLPRVRERHPDAWFLGEVIHGDYAAFVAESTMDSVTQYELWKAIWSSLLDRNFYELDWTLTRHAELLEHLVPNTFVGNHDVTRIASTLGPDRAVLALAILLTVGGIPSVYYGDEWGFEGVKEERLGGDDAVRPALPEEPGHLAGRGETVLQAHRELIALRRRHPWLATAVTEQTALSNTHYAYSVRARDGEGSLAVTLDVTDVPSVQVRDADGRELWGYRAAAGSPG